MTWQTITISDILDHYLNTGPFDNQTQIYHLNTRLVRYSDDFCTTPLFSTIQNLDMSGFRIPIVFLFCHYKVVFFSFSVAFANDLIVVPVINKIDLPNADPDTVKTQLEQLFEIK